MGTIKWLAQLSCGHALFGQTVEVPLKADETETGIVWCPECREGRLIVDVVDATPAR